jgi:short-subunit dehydrogenase
MEISGAKVLVTGATGGLGQAIARTLGARGARLVLTGRKTELIASLAGELGAEVIRADLADPEDVARLAAACGDVDVLVANAGLPGSGPYDSFSVEQIDRTLAVNLRAPMVLARELGPRMAERGRGSIVFVSSLLGKAATPGTAIYSATKFGLRGFAFALRADLHGTGVGVTVISPGFIRDAGMFAASGAKLPPGLGTKPPEDVARAVVRAIERGPAEIEVAPVTLRVGATFASVAPGAAEAVARRLGSAKISAQIWSGQRSRR